MMKPYGLLLENFQENSGSVNDCVFTMMHHISGDLSCPEVHRLKGEEMENYSQG
jgi:hypothetical protein